MNENTAKNIKDLYTEIVSKYNDKYLNNTLTREDGDELFNEIVFKKYLNIDPESEKGQKIKKCEEYLSYDEALVAISVGIGTLHLPNTRDQETETTDAFKMLATHFATMILLNLKHWKFQIYELKSMTDDEKRTYADFVKMKEIIKSTEKELKKSDDNTSVQQSIAPTDDQEKESNDKDSLQKRIRELENDPRVQEYMSVRCKLCEIELSEEMAEKNSNESKEAVTCQKKT
jgi:hypothetical protein